MFIQTAVYQMIYKLGRFTSISNVTRGQVQSWDNFVHIQYSSQMDRKYMCVCVCTCGGGGYGGGAQRNETVGRSSCRNSDVPGGGDIMTARHHRYALRQYLAISARYENVVIMFQDRNPYENYYGMYHGVHFRPM